MRAAGYILGFVLTGLLGGCAGAPPPAPVAPVKISVTSSDFCGVMRRLHGAGGKLSWDVADTPATAHGIRRVNRAFDQRCGVKPSTPTS